MLPHSASWLARSHTSLLLVRINVLAAADDLAGGDAEAAGVTEGAHQLALNLAPHDWAQSSTTCSFGLRATRMIAYVRHAAHHAGRHDATARSLPACRSMESDASTSQNTGTPR
jgi:hypothetical protein